MQQPPIAAAADQTAGHGKRKKGQDAGHASAKRSKQAELHQAQQHNSADAAGTSADGGDDAQAKRPSRSARRKAAKRKLKRTGVLPYGKPSGSQQAPKPQQKASKPRQATGAAAPVQQPSVAMQLASSACALNPNMPSPAPAPANGLGVSSSPAARAPSQQQRGRANGTASAPGTSKAGGSRGPQKPAAPAAPSSSSDDSSSGEDDETSSSSAASSSEEESSEPSSDASSSSDSEDSSSEEPSSSSESSSSEESSDGSSSSEEEEEAEQPTTSAPPQQQKRTQPAAPGSTSAQPAAGTGARTQALPPPPQLQLDFDQLPKLSGLPQPEDILAYKMLEIGPNFAPQVSEPRYGKVSGVEGTGPSDASITLVPWPDAGCHPLQAQLEAWKAEQQEADEEFVFDYYQVPFTSSYQEDGTLVAQMDAFLEVRLVQFVPGRQLQASQPAPQQQPTPSGSRPSGSGLGRSNGTTPQAPPSASKGAAPSRPWVPGGRSSGRQCFLG